MNDELLVIGRSGSEIPFLPRVLLRFRVRSLGLGEVDPLCFPGFRKMKLHNKIIPMNFL